jgi:nucleoside-diphosphate-sugar epimerase
MNILITGGSGFLGQALTPRLLNKGHKVYSLSRHPPAPSENLVPLIGDILQPNLGLSEIPKDIHAVHHLAAIHRLGDDKDGSIWETNVGGTRNVLEFCTAHKIPHLYFVSSAYTQGRNTYEQSKALCETMVKAADIPQVTIFKPSIVMGTAEHFYPGHFSQFVALVIKIHQRAEIVRRKVEGTLRFPIIEPVFRLRANPAGKLNLVPIDAVADAMAEIEEPGTFWLTHPNPPTLSELVEWVGSFIMVKIQIEPTFRATPIEALFAKMSAAFTPYLWGGDFPSDLKKCPPITKEFITSTIKRSL